MFYGYGPYPAGGRAGHEVLRAKVTNQGESRAPVYISLRKSLKTNMAEGVGFEPTIDYSVFMDVRYRPNWLKHLLCIKERKLLNKYGRYQHVDGKHYKKLRSKY